MFNHDYELEKRYHPENFDPMDTGREVCIYGSSTDHEEVTGYCEICQVPLCHFCGYTINDFRYCNDHEPLRIPTTKEHFDKYEALAEKLDIKCDGINYLGISAFQWYKLVKADHNLNNQPLKFFDNKYINSSGSLAESVCLHKHMIRFHLLNSIPVYE